MKRVLFISFFFNLFISSIAQHHFTVEVSNLKNDTVVVALIDKTISFTEQRDTVIAHNGHFTYDCPDANNARMLFFCFSGTAKPIMQQAFYVPGERGFLKGPAQEAKWSGSFFYNELAKLKEAPDASVFAKQNPTSPALATILVRLDPNIAEPILDAMPDSIKNGSVKALINVAEKNLAKEKARIKAEKEIKVGSVAPVFTLEDIDGSLFTLSSLRGKYVILDFWGSWCGWCIKGLPKMKEYYQKYRNLLEIVGIDCNDRMQDWKKAVQAHMIPWINVYNHRTSDLCTKYAVYSYPTKIIIDPNGKIVKKTTGESEQFYEFLDSLIEGGSNQD